MNIFINCYNVRTYLNLGNLFFVPLHQNLNWEESWKMLNIDQIHSLRSRLIDLLVNIEHY